MKIKYLKAKEFIDYAKTLNVQTEEYDLEKYEEKGFLYPVYRVVLPIEYVKKYNPTTWYKDPFKNSIDERYEEAYKVDNLNGFSFVCPESYKTAIRYATQLDSYCLKEQNKCIYTPVNTAFKPWKEYEFYDTENPEYPGIKLDFAKSYYAEWQVFVLYELNKYNSHVINALTNSRRGYGCTPYHSMFSCSSEIVGKVYDYKCIDDYLLFKFIYVNPEERKVKEYNEAIKGVAHRLYKECNETDWIKFIREIVQIYKEYRKDEKYKLADEIKGVLTKTITLIITATGKTIEEISDFYEGKFKGSHSTRCMDKDKSLIDVGAIKEMYDTEYRYTDENVNKILLSYANVYAPLVNENKNTLCEKIIQDIKSNGCDYFIIHMVETRHLWEEKPLFWQAALWSQIRSFIAAIETLCKIWYGEKHLGPNIEKAFGAEYSTLKQSIGNKLTDAETLDKFLENLAKIIKHSDEKLHNDSNVCNRNLLITHLLRNYLMHNIKTQDNQLRSEDYFIILNSLIYSTLSLFCKYQIITEVN